MNLIIIISTLLASAFFSGIEIAFVSANRLKIEMDKNNGVFMHQLYEDIRAAGVNENFNGRIYGNRPSDRFAEGWKTVLNANLPQYEDLAELPKTVSNASIQKNDGKLTLEVNLAPHSVKLIELIPQ